MQTKPLTLIALVEFSALSSLLLLAFFYTESAGVFSRHMIIHIALMTVAAPVVAGLLHGFTSSATGFSGLCAAATLQTVMLFIWHAPSAISLTMHDHGKALWLQAMLFGSALWFWHAALTQAGKHLWRAVIALLLTGKAFCLIAVLLVFAPRVLYSGMAVDLADQQLAGLLMITVCPLTYVLAAITLIFRWFHTFPDTHSPTVMDKSA
ncbi:MAG: cytochrome c oxidase assembly protein [Methylobacter sp.]